MRDLDQVFESLARSAFRRKFRLNAEDHSYARAKGVAVLHEHALDFVAKRLAPATPKNDGKQTPWRGHPVFVAQHATATCCRTCLAKWHGIEAGGDLNEAEQRHIVDAIDRWLGQNI